MSRKLTLSLDDTAINHAKFFAKNHHTSVSKLVQAYFVSLAKPTPSQKISSHILKLKGALKNNLTTDDKTALTNSLKKKYQ